MDIVMRRRGR